MASYCEYISNPNTNGVEYHKHYHDNHYGFPVHNDNELFGRLILEINQAGLNWLTILKKESNFRKAYSNFSIQKIANYTQKDIERLLNDTGIIRNKLKVAAIVHNAQQVLAIQQQYGSFEGWLNHHHQLSKKEWVGLFKKTFKFTGGEIVNEFLLSTGYLQGAHTSECPIHPKVLSHSPIWAQKTE